MTADLIGQLSLALDATGQVIAGIRVADWGAPTPCPDWTVRDLVSHIVTGNDRFAAILSGWPAGAPGDAGAPGQAAPGDTAPAGDEDLVRRYRESARALVGAFGQPGVLERVVTVPFGTVPGAVALHLRLAEALVHGWDLAQATGQAASFPEDIAEQELAWSRGALGQVPPARSPFAPPQPVADDAPAIDRLVACLGRDVTGPR
jgi:uncharacterized protein (TIGR03086 family)